MVLTKIDFICSFQRTNHLLKIILRNYQKPIHRPNFMASNQQNSAISNKRSANEAFNKKSNFGTPRESGSTLNVHVVSNGFMNTPKGCVISTDTSYLMINCGEGTERCLSQNNLKPTRIDNILITRFDWQRLGGLQGMTTHISEYNRSINIQLHSPVDFKLEDKTRNYRKFFIAKNCSVRQHSYTTRGDFTGDMFKIQKIDMTLAPESHSSVWSYLIKFNKVNVLIN